MDKWEIKEYKKYIGVTFKSLQNDVIPKCWLTTSSTRKSKITHYPNSDIQSKAKSRVTPESSWGKYKVKIICHSSEYQELLFNYF